MARRVEKIHPHAFRVIEEVTYLEDDGKPSELPPLRRQWGPYATVGAAKGIRTGMKHDNERWPRTRSLVEYHIEKSPVGDWERVED